MTDNSVQKHRPERVSAEGDFERTVMSDVRARARLALHRFGIDAKRFRPHEESAHALAMMLKTNGVDTVLDIGANQGQFAIALRRAGFDGRIVSFEPLSAAHDLLVSFARRDSNWAVAPPMAIGDHDGTVLMHVSANAGQSSSVLPVLEASLEAEPASRYVDEQEAPIACLDTIAHEYAPEGSRLFIKVDVQGYEPHVLAGAARTLRRTIGLQLEMSLVPLYDGQVLFPELLEQVHTAGFDLWAIQPAFIDARNARMLQVDGIFFTNCPTD
jgi:FkbM family methyltransferase